MGAMQDVRAVEKGKLSKWQHLETVIVHKDAWEAAKRNAAVLRSVIQAAKEWRNQAKHARAEASMIRRTVKCETTAEDRLIVRSEQWDACADMIGEVLSEEIGDLP